MATSPLSVKPRPSFPRKREPMLKSISNKLPVPATANSAWVLYGRLPFAKYFLCFVDRQLQFYIRPCLHEELSAAGPDEIR